MSARRTTTPTGGRRRRLAVGLTAAALTALAGPLAGGAQAESLAQRLGLRPAGNPFAATTQNSDRLRQTMDAAGPAAAAAQTAHRERVESATWKAERRRSRHAFHGLGATDARRLTQQQFGRALDTVSAVPTDALKGERVLQWQGTNRAVADPPGPRAREEIVSQQPLRSAVGSGHLAPLDLTLGNDGRGWAPANPAVPVTLPGSSDDAATVGGGISVTASLGGDGATGTPLGDNAVFYPGTGTDADLTTSPVVSGLETFFTLRSSDAPEDGTLTFRLPAGAVLLAQDDGSVLVRRGTKTLGHISAPTAVDAQGTSVPTTATVHGDTITIHTAHHGGDYAYPILVDPTVDIDAFDPLDTDVNDFFLGDGGGTSSPTGAWIPIDFTTGNMLTTGTYGDGLYINDPMSGSGGVRIWAWYPPAQAHINSIDFGPYDLDLDGDTTSIGSLGFLLINNGATAQFTTADQTNDGYQTVHDDDDVVTGGGTGYAVEFTLGRPLAAPNTYTHDHRAYLGGMVAHMDLPDESDFGDAGGPWIWGAISAPEEQVFWFNETEVPGEVPATSKSGRGVKKIEATVQQGTDPETVVGGYTDPCAGTVGDPCPTDLDEPFDVDLSGLSDGDTGRLRLRAYDPDGLRSTAASATIGLDQTGPTVDLGGDVADLDGTTTSSTATLDLTADVSDASSGPQQLSAEDSESDWASDFVDCTAAACDPTTFHVPLGDLSNGSHTITVHATDVAGNETDQHVTFTVTGH